LSFNPIFEYIGGVMEKRTARILFIWGTGICAAVFIWLTIDTHTAIPKRTHTDELTEEVILGKRVWHRYNCNDCHTILGIGGYYSPDVTKAYSIRGEAWLKAFLKRPESPDSKRRKMVDFHLSKEEINRLITFFKWVDGIDTNQWPPKPIGEGKITEVVSKREPQEALGKGVFEKYRCDLCHKVGGEGGMIGPELTHEGSKRNARWLENHIRDPKSHDPNTVMPPFPQITKGELNALVDYLTNLK